MFHVDEEWVYKNQYGREVTVRIVSLERDYRGRVCVSMYNTHNQQWQDQYVNPDRMVAPCGYQIAD